ncbi:RNA-directed DNA polymerase, eukaryota, Reverse transcriptase zinc-binding domain protein [Artemisia annua]|uniref:RNA-directed DNA polymerase, eukaryota, Reverse transcriptase zinc-binding domain protein n=1 Tax=Artemisia annua TaxID=35608 RepID=A0A2U1PIZ1_ARTAN|nr:RNA-directed DNA polymerase, eukaryota, Reverse transcriptase zinc-binding domain protein [Artemisia annua]
MNVLSLNIRGLGVPGKATWFKGLRKEHDVGFVLFQESGYANVSESILESYWGYGDFGFEVVEPVGRSGGIVSMWDKRLFEPSDIIKHRNFLLVSGVLKGFGAVCNIINVYAPQRDVDKRLLWSELAALINSKVGLWVVALLLRGVGILSLTLSHENRFF